MDFNVEFDLIVNQYLYINVHFYEYFYEYFIVDFINNNHGLVDMKFDSAFWDVIWSRKYERYNGHHRAIWAAVLPFIKGRVCDLGCGPCVIYDGTDINFLGVDSSQEAINQAMIRHPGKEFVVGDATDTKLLEHSFDTVVMLGLLDYFDDWNDVLKEARRLVKPGGKIVATLLNGFRGHDWTKYKHVTSNWYLYVE